MTHYSSISISATSFLLGTREVRVQTRRPVIMNPSIIVTLMDIGTSWHIRGGVPQNWLRPGSCNIPPIRSSLPPIIRCYIIWGTHSNLRPRQRWSSLSAPRWHKGECIQSYPQHETEVNGQHHASVALPPGKNPRYPFQMKVSGPQSRSGRFAEEKNRLPAPGFETPDHSARKSSHYTDYATPAPSVLKYSINK